MSDYQEYTVRVYLNGDKFWHQNGKYHRLDGPAIEYSNGKFHRLDGPAIEFTNGTKEWWIDGVKYTEEEFNEYLHKFIFNSGLKELLDYVNLEFESAAESHSCKSCEKAAKKVYDFMDKYRKFFENDA